jgi:16S rRNA processing protein RimM
VRGWVRVVPHSPLAEVLRATRNWWLVGAEAARPLQLSGLRAQGSDLVAKWDGCDSREMAEALKGKSIAVERGDFPQLPGQEYYWVDLIGLRVINRSQRELGIVKGLRSSAAHDLLEVEPGALERHRPGRDMLIPVVGEYIDGIEVDAGVVRVNWEPEWLE